MNEHSFTRSLMDSLPTVIHVQSMTFGSLSFNGTPDRYLDHFSDLWVEFKFVHVGRIVPIGDLVTTLQKRWLKRRWTAGKNACVIVGHAIKNRSHGVVFDHPQEWEQAYTKDEFLARSRTKSQLVEYIVNRVGRHANP